MGQTQRVRRRTLSCARCRRRKTMCDAKSPACSSCLEAGVPCLAWNASANAAAPRSITRYLEERIANLERRGSEQETPSAWLENVRISQDNMASFSKQLPRSCLALNSMIGDVLHDTTTTFLGLTPNICLAECGAAPTQLPSAQDAFGLSDLDKNHPRTILNQQPSTLTPTSVPVQVAKFLFNTYVTRVIPQYPVFHVEDVEKAFNVVFDNKSTESSHVPNFEIRCIYIVSLMMAISLSTAARNKQAQAHFLSACLFKYALQHVSLVLTNDLFGLQALLILVQYVYFNPSVANLWLITGISSEACIDMGLHQELPDDAGVDIHERDLRRRLFWCSWEMEVAVSAGFHRPIRTKNHYINVSFPSEFEEHTARNAASRMQPRLKSLSHCIWLFRKLESEVMSVLHQNEPLPKDAPSLEVWTSMTDAKIKEWLQQVRQAASWNEDVSLESQWEEMLLYGETGYQYLKVHLYGPSPRVAFQSRQNLMKAFGASARVARGYWEQSNTEFGRIKYAFHPCYHAFSAAVVFLQVLQNCKAEVAELHTLEEVNYHAYCFSRLFSIISERWPAAERCHQEYDRLLGPIKKEYSDYLLRRTNNYIQEPPLQNSGSTSQFNEMIDIPDYSSLMPVFDPLLSRTDDALTYHSMGIPYDWNAAFEFGMDMVDEEACIWNG